MAGPEPRKLESFCPAKIKKTGDTTGSASLTKILAVRDRRGWKVPASA